MAAYVIRRLLYTIPIVLGVLLVTFVLFNLVGGDVSADLAGKSASAETIAEIKRELGWDKPVFADLDALGKGDLRKAIDSQFVNHFIKALTFRFGRSRVSGQEVWTELKARAPASLSLAVPMFLGTLFISIAISLGVAFVRGTWLDVTVVFVCVVGMSLPMLSYILFGMYFLAYKLGWFPVVGYEPGLAAFKYVALPCLLGIVSGLGSNVRFYRTVMLDEMRADYVRTAFAKGLGVTRVLFRHVLKNAMVPIISTVVLAIPFLFLGSLLLERFFMIPGLGSFTVDAVTSRDYAVVNAMTFIGALLYVAGQLATDLCYALVDPRISFE
jgi:peptide/nickel transport system permease protein